MKGSLEAISGILRWVNNVGVGGVRGPGRETRVRVWEEGLVLREAEEGFWQLGEELVGLECPSSWHLPPGSLTLDLPPHQSWRERQGGRGASLGPIRYTST